MATTNRLYAISEESTWQLMPTTAQERNIMNRHPVLPGKVAWTGDNPFIYLKEDPHGDFSSLSVFFRINYSPCGIGQAAVCVIDPYGENGYGVVLTDNLVMAQYLVKEFLSRFVLFRPCTFMDSLEYVDNAHFEQVRHGNNWSEIAQAADRNITLTWNNLGEPFAADVPGPQSGTGEHEMFSVFQIAESASVILDGKRLPGSTIERDFLNGRGQSAGMAISETWVET